MEQFAKITKYTGQERNVIGFTGRLVTNLQRFYALTGAMPMPEVLMMDKECSCIGIVGTNKSFLWTKESDFNIEIEHI